MAASKSNTSLLAAQATTFTSAAVDVSTHYADTVAGSITQTGTATTPAQIQVQESFDGGATYLAAPTKLFAALLAAGTYPFEIAVDPAADHVKVTYTQQIGGTSSACTAQLGSLLG